ncbi:hypothetical protein HK405_001041, partial [Cladochytrium tenue]
MHAKLMVLWHPGSLRVVVTSANLVPHDWSLLENVAYVEDFPELDAAGAAAAAEDGSEEKTTGARFHSDLCTVLREMGCPDSVIEATRGYDYSRTKATLVFSRPGSFGPADMSRYGQGRLAAVTTRFCAGWPAAAKPSLTYQTSSLGSLSRKWLHEFGAAALGGSAERSAASAFEVVFPSSATVEKSLLGVD